ncbi:MAG: DUF2752 domain-containing protein [Kiritimatiellae bacterium]|nr:DUF2752 domain-containing protein [Kiritimatiellia bacterium]
MKRKSASSDGSAGGSAARFALALAAAGALILAAHFAGFAICPVKRLFGVPCPTCGATRAALAALGGDVAGAFAMQPLAMFALLVAAPVALLCTAALGRERTLRAAGRIFRSPLAWTALAAAVLANWAYVISIGN